MINPMTAFIRWFDSLPANLRKRLAHAYRVCTTDDTADIIMDPDESLDRFKGYFVKPDFPMRVAARLFTVRAVFDMILVNRDQFNAAAGQAFPGRDGDNIVQLSDRQWDTIFKDWHGLRKGFLSDPHLHAWAAEMIRRGRKGD